MNHLDSELDEEVVEEEFRFPELLKRPVLQPFLIILVMMVLLQFSGQGAVTFYTAQIFKVRTNFQSPIVFLLGPLLDLCLL